MLFRSLDVSDGLVADLRHLCETSGLDAVVDEADVPLSEAARAALHVKPSVMDAILTGGDDYEIAFAAPSGAAGRVAAIAGSLFSLMAQYEPAWLPASGTGEIDCFGPSHAVPPRLGRSAATPPAAGHRSHPSCQRWRKPNAIRGPAPRPRSLQSHPGFARCKSRSDARRPPASACPQNDNPQ